MKLNKSCECPVINEGAITELHNQEKWEMEKKTCEYYWASSVLDKLDEIMDRTYNPSWTSSIAASMVRRSENTAWNHQAATDKMLVDYDAYLGVVLPIYKEVAKSGSDNVFGLISYADLPAHLKATLEMAYPDVRKTLIAVNL